jgi:hypothetical protein
MCFMRGVLRKRGDTEIELRHGGISHGGGTEDLIDRVAITTIIITLRLRVPVANLCVLKTSVPSYPNQEPRTRT